MRKASKEQAASRIFACGPGVEPRIQWKLEQSYNDLKRKPHSLVPTFVLFLAPLPLPMESGLGNIAFIDGEYKQV